METLLVQIVIGATSSVVLTLAVAVLLVTSQTAKYRQPEQDQGLKFPVLKQNYSDLPALITTTLSGKTPIPFRRYPASTANRPILLLIHGSAWHSMQFHQLAQVIAGQGVAEVIVPDMRGHGPTPERRGDVDYIGQMEDDIAALIALVGQDRRVILGGHSSGGGFVVRFAGGKHGHKVDGFLLLAPFLHHRAPTVRRNSGGWARPAVRRLIGLSILNRFKITALNALPVISFAMPRAVLDGPLGKTATLTYSYRLNVGFAPRPTYKSDLSRLTKPFLLLAGDEDEAFVAQEFEPLISAYTSFGTYGIVQGVGHLDLVSSRSAEIMILNWLKKQ